MAGLDSVIDVFVSGCIWWQNATKAWELLNILQVLSIDGDFDFIWWLKSRSWLEQDRGIFHVYGESLVHVDSGEVVRWVLEIFGFINSMIRPLVVRDQNWNRAVLERCGTECRFQGWRLKSPEASPPSRLRRGYEQEATYLWRGDGEGVQKTGLILVTTHHFFRVDLVWVPWIFQGIQSVWEPATWLVLEQSHPPFQDCRNLFYYHDIFISVYPIVWIQQHTTPGNTLSNTSFS